jgi:hypothetical protein
MKTTTLRQRDMAFHKKVNNLRAIHLEARLRRVEPLPEIVLPTAPQSKQDEMRVKIQQLIAKHDRK